MSTRCGWSLAVAAALLIVALAAASVEGLQVEGQEQWLQYRGVREPWQAVPDVGFVPLTTTTEKPEGLGLPKFAGPQPIFARWSTPMVKSGGLWLAFDRSLKGGGYDLLYIDANANGSLADETATKPYASYETLARFSPVKVRLDMPDGPTAYHLLIDFSTVGGVHKVHAVSAGTYEGTVTVGGKKWRCVLADHNANGAFNDTSTRIEQMDRICIAPAAQLDGAGLDTLYVGKYAELDAVLYRLLVARDGAWVGFTPAGEVPMGKVRVTEETNKLSIAGENGLFRLRLDRGAAQALAGKYCVSRWVIARKDKAGKNWEMERSYFPEGADFEVRAGEEMRLPVGEPVTASVDSKKEGEEYKLNRVLRGALGEQVRITREGDRPPAPKLRITNAGGTYDRSFQMEYG